MSFLETSITFFIFGLVALQGYCVAMCEDFFRCRPSSCSVSVFNEGLSYHPLYRSSFVYWPSSFCSSIIRWKRLGQAEDIMMPNFGVIMAPHSSTLAWKIPWTEEPVRPQSMGSLWRRQWHPTPVFLPGKSHGQRSLLGYSPWGCKESDMTEWLHFRFSGYMVSI